MRTFGISRLPALTLASSTMSGGHPSAPLTAGRNPSVGTVDLVGETRVLPAPPNASRQGFWVSLLTAAALLCPLGCTPNARKGTTPATRKSESSRTTAMALNQELNLPKGSSWSVELADDYILWDAVLPIRSVLYCSDAFEVLNVKLSKKTTIRGHSFPKGSSVGSPESHARFSAFIPVDAVFDGIPAAGGTSVYFHRNDRLWSATLSKDHPIDGTLVPAGTNIHLDENGHLTDRNP